MRQQSKIRSFDNMVMYYFQQTRPECKIEKFYTTDRQNKSDCFSVDGFFVFQHCVWRNVLLLPLCINQEVRPSLSEEDFQHGSKKRELAKLRGSYSQEKGFTVFDLWGCEWWRLYKTTTYVKQHIRENFPYKPSLTEHQLLEGSKKGNFFGNVQWDIEIPKTLRAFFANFPPTFKNTWVSKDDIGELVKMYPDMPMKKE